MSGLRLWAEDIAGVVFSPWALVAAAAVVIGIIIFPWIPAQPAVYKGFDRNLLYIDTAGGTATGHVDLNPARAVITTSQGSRSTLHLATVLGASDDLSASFDATVRQDSSFASWQRVSVNVTKPATARYFVVLLGAVDSSVLFDEIAVGPVVDSTKPQGSAVFAEGFQDRGLSGWHITQGVEQVPISPSPNSFSLQIVAPSGVENGAWTNEIGPVPVGAQVYSVSAFVRLDRGAGPFKIAVDWLDTSRKHITYSPDWRDWSAYFQPGVALQARLWYPREQNTVDIQFVASPARQIRASTFDGHRQSPVTVLGSYELNTTYRVFVTWKKGETANFRIVDSSGRAVSYSVDRSSGLSLFRERWVDLSLDSSAALGSQQIELSNLTLEIPPQTTFASKTSDRRLTISVLMLAIWILAFIAFRGRPRKRSGSMNRFARSDTATPARESSRWRLLALVAPSVLVLVAAYASLTPIDAYPYDRLSQETYAYVAAQYGLGALYERTSLAPDSAVRGGQAPWSNVPFAYPPVMAYPFWFIGKAWQLFHGDIVPMHDRTFQIFWKSSFALFVLVDSAVLFRLLKRAGGQKWALFGIAAFAFNPAVVFDAAIWGETEAFLLAALLISVLAFVSDKPKLGWSSLILGVLIKQTALLALPILAVYSLKRFGLRRSLFDGSYGLLMGFLLVSPLLAAGYSPITIPRVDIAQIASFAASPPDNASADTFSIWTLVTGLHGLHGFDRIMAPYPLTLTGIDVNFSTLGSLAFISIIALILLRLWLTPNSTLSDRDLFLSLAAVMASYVTLSTGGSSRYLLLSLPFVILSLRHSSSFARLWMIGGLTATAFVSMYGLYMVVAVRGEWPIYYGLGNPSTNTLGRAVYSVYTSDLGLTAFALVLLSLTVALLVRLFDRRTSADLVTGVKLQAEGSLRQSGGASSEMLAP